MTRLSDLAPDDVAVFVRADGSESEPFVLGEFIQGRNVRIQYADDKDEFSGDTSCRRLGRGRRVPSRIEMEGEADLAEQVANLRAALSRLMATCWGSDTPECALPFASWSEALPICHAAIAATAPPTPEAAR